MASSRKRVVDCVSVGEPPKKINKHTETIRFVVHDFKNRKEKRGVEILSPIAKAHGYNWRISVCPRGCSKSKTDHEYVSCYLILVGNSTAVMVTFSLRCKTRNRNSSLNSFERFDPGNGYPNFVQRQNVIDSCLEDDGSFVVECDIRIAEEDRHIWYPTKLQPQSVLVDFYNDASSKVSDAVFAVGDSTYHAHKVVLSQRCKKLYEIAEDSGDDDTPIPIVSVKAEIFKSLLDFVYTVKTPEIETKELAIQLLTAADLYDCIQLKLYAESVLVDKFLDTTTAAGLLVFADSNSCALLKEAATNSILTEIDTVKATRDWDKIIESKRLFEELFNALSSKRGGHTASVSTSTSSPVDEVDRLDVTTLRQDLQQANVEVDGSREVLVNRWKALKTEGSDP